MISVLLMDDEPAANARTRGLLEAHPKVLVIGVVESVAEAIAFMKQRKPDVILMDVNLPGQHGLELLPWVNASQTAIVFVTAYDHYAVTAFDAGAIDYMVKPVSPERLALMVERMEASITKRQQKTEAETNKCRLLLHDSLSFAVSGTKELRICQLSDIVWIEAMQNYSRIQLKNEPNILTVRRSLSEWQELAGEPFFFRLTRSLMIQIDSLRSTEWNSRNQSFLRFDQVMQPLSIGRQAAARLKEILTKREHF
jgi:DNA-binding LytR/AlgR family response regulator